MCGKKFNEKFPQNAHILMYALLFSLFFIEFFLTAERFLQHQVTVNDKNV